MTADDPRPGAGEAGGAARRFYVPEAGGTGGVALRGERAHRLTRVLRLRPGDRVEVFDGSGRSWEATIDAAGRDAVHLALGAARLHPPAPETLLLAALIRPNRFEWLVEKATELGVTAIQPLVTERCAVRPAEIGAARLERWRRIAAEAAEQCGRVTLPEILPPLSLEAALDGARGRLAVAAEPAHGPATPLAALLRGVAAEAVTLLVGPEGGFTPEEVRTAERAGARAASLGPLVLRAETAALAALAVLASARAAGATADS